MYHETNPSGESPVQKQPERFDNNDSDPLAADQLPGQAAAEVHFGAFFDRLGAGDFFEPNDAAAEGMLPGELCDSLCPNGPYVACCRGAMILENRWGIFSLVEERNHATKKLEMVKVRRTFLNEYGRRMSIEKPMLIFQFIQRFHSVKCTKSEWAAIVEACKPGIDRDAAIWADEQQHQKRQSERLRQAAESRLNPQASLGQAIAAGLAIIQKGAK